MPGFFALAAETPTFRAARLALRRNPEAADSLRPSAGGANEKGRGSGACCRPATSTWQSPDCRIRVTEPETPILRAGLVPTSERLHAPSTGSMGQGNRSDLFGRTLLPRGALQTFRPFVRPEHLCREEDDL